jgi:hypothetical protein
MPNSACVFVVLLILSGISAAQETAPAFDLFGGYSYLKTDADLPNRSRHGWEVAGSFHLNRWLGVTLDSSRHWSNEFEDIPFSTKDSAHIFLIGPTFSYRVPKFSAFAHLLFGAASVRETITDLGETSGETDFASAYGGGLDWHAGQHWGIRLTQMDYLKTKFANASQNNLRVSAGLVIRFGSR